MGQYYKPAKVNEEGEPEAFVYSHDYNNGLKLMEHSYIGNTFMQAVESLLIPSGDWYKQRIVWAGDYADPIDVFLDGDEQENVYGLCEDELQVNPEPLTDEEAEEYRFVVNFDTQQFVEKPSYVKDYFKVHPLSLLTADGNGRGGGDYRDDSDFVGIWIGNRIGLEKTAPEGFERVVVDFEVDY